MSDVEEGGVVLDGIHELDYLGWLFGSIEYVVSETGRLSDLEIQAEDYSSMIIGHCGGVRSEVHLDYLRRAKRRGCEIAGTQGILDWQSEGKAPEDCMVRLYLPETGWKTILRQSAVDTAAPLATAIETFIAALQGKETDLHTGREALYVLRAALAARSGDRYVKQIS